MTDITFNFDTSEYFDVVEARSDLLNELAVMKYKAGKGDSEYSKDEVW